MIQIKKEYYKMTEECLESYKLIKAYIETLQSQLKEIDIIFKRKSIVYYDGNDRKTYNLKRTLEQEDVEIIEKRENIIFNIEKFNEKVTRIDKALHSIDENAKKILIYKYIYGYQWKKISSEVSYNERWCKEIRKRAITKIALVLYGQGALKEYSFLDVI